MLIHSYIPSCFGFGDFIRGHIALIQKYGIENVSISLQDTCLKHLFKSSNFTNYNSNLKVKRENWYDKNTYLDKHIKPVNDVICCNHFFKHPISLDIKTYIKNIFEPNNETALIVTDLIKELELYNFNVLHIRNSLEVTENVLNETPLSIKQYKNILKVIEENSSKDCIWFVCSDTYFDKLLFDKKKFRYLSVKPVHSSVHNTLPFEVLCEHFIMRHSNKIIQVTDVHPRHFWGSGYSDSVNWGWDVPILHYDTQGYKKDIYFDKEEGLRIIKR